LLKDLQMVHTPFRTTVTKSRSHWTSAST